MAIKERKMRRESAAVSSSSNSGKNNDTQTNNSNNSTSSMWMDWIEKSVDLLCEDSCSNASKGVIREALRIPQTCPQPDLHAVDYAALHDEFLESLLFEQAQNHSKRQQQQQQLYDDSSAATSLILDEASQSTFSCSTNNSVSLLDEDETTSSRKRRRPIRLHRRRTPPSHRRKTRVAALFENRSESNISEQLQLGSNSSFSSSVSFMNLSKTDYDHPSHYLHPQCRMQKDKGRGEAVGANICAKGRDACLLKLRAKMHLLTEYAAGSSTSSNSADRNSNSTIGGGGGSSSSSSKGTMKRRKAIVAAHYDNFIETRSLIELRMGFLSLQYGVLLRWDTGRTGKVTLVVLRKMCHDSFYHGILKKQQHLQQQQQRRMFAQRPDSGHVVDANNAIFSRPDGMEVTLLEPPFQVSRPDEFAPSMLRVSVLEVVGVSRKTNWMMQVSYDAVSENIPLTYNMDRSCFLPKTKRPLKKVISEQEAIASVDIKLYELCSRRHRRRPRLDALHQHRLVHSVRIPLADYVQPQPSSSNSNHNPPVPTTRVRIPFPNNNNSQQDDNAASIYVELLFQSDYACWLMQELEARRRRQERKTSDFFSSFMEEENESPWEWMLCCFC